MDSLRQLVLPAPVRSLLRRTALAYLHRREQRRRAPRKIIWILAHMRSGSTLLMHLLSSHPEILGAGERNTTYNSAADLTRLGVEAAYARRQLFRDPDYVVDQINHTRFLPVPDLLDDARVFRIFLIREPQTAVASMVEVLGQFYGMTREEAVDYYLERLPSLTQNARGVADQGRSFYLSYDDLVASPGPVLRRLERFLALRTPLSKSYQVFDFTGGSGDPSQRIRSGRVRGDLPPRHIELDEPTSDRLSAAYANCSAVLAKHCATSGARG